MAVEGRHVTEAASIIASSLHAVAKAIEQHAVATIVTSSRPPGYFERAVRDARGALNQRSR